MATSQAAAKPAPTSSAPAPAKSNTEQVLEQDPTSFGAMAQQSGSADTALVAADEAPLPAARVYEDAPTFDPSEVTMPRLRIAQGLTPEVQAGEAKVGDVLLLGYEPVKEAVFIPVAFNRSRRRPDPTDNTAMPLCQSPDARHGIGDPGIDCNVCPFARWKQAAVQGGKNTPPECAISYSYIGYSPTFEAHAELSIRAKTKGAMEAAKKLNMFIQSIGLGKFAIELSSAAAKNAKGASFYVPTVRKVTAEAEDFDIARSVPLSGSSTSEGLGVDAGDED